jgi:hypothetical protein
VADTSTEEVFTQPDTLSAGLVTAYLVDGPMPALQVTWIGWNSSFRGSGLQVADQILAVSGQKIVQPADPVELQRIVPRLVGQYGEADAWRDAGAKEGDRLTLAVRRRVLPGTGWDKLEFTGTLQPARTYVNAAGRHLIGPGGPDEMASDSFSESWTSWNERIATTWSRVLNDGWQHATSFINQSSLDAHRAQEARITALETTYPGPYAAAMRADWDSVLAAYLGRTYPLASDALEYRRLGEQRAADVASAGQVARSAFLTARAADLIPPFPTIDPIKGDRATVAGKLVELPPVTTQDWINQGSTTAFVFAEGDGRYVAEGEGRGIVNLLRAQRRYEELVTPSVQEDYDIIATVLGEPALVVVDATGQFALRVEPAAAWVGDAFFVDLTPAGTDPPFAGEETIRAVTRQPPPVDATPAQVMSAFYDALKAANRGGWAALFVDWSLTLAANGTPVVVPGALPNLESTWDEARRRILDDVADVRVLWVDDPTTVVSGREFAGAPVIDEVVLQVEHLRLDAQGVARAFTRVGLNPMWTLQRLNAGPWRVATVQGI